jgi:hypothetical protein
MSTKITASTAAHALFLALALLFASAPLAGCEKSAPKRKTPVCATTDCATKKVVDDGCAEDEAGKRVCLSCTNPCPGEPPSPR